MNSNNNNNSNNNRITVTLDRKVYEHIKQHGKMGNTFSQVIEKVLLEKEGKEVNEDGRSW